MSSVIGGGGSRLPTVNGVRDGYNSASVDGVTGSVCEGKNDTAPNLDVIAEVPEPPLAGPAMQPVSRASRRGLAFVLGSSFSVSVSRRGDVIKTSEQSVRRNADSACLST